MMKVSRIAAFLLVLLAIAPAALAQQTATPPPSAGGTAQALQLGTPLTVFISGTVPVTLTYKSNGNETVSITARSLEAEDVLDPILSLIDPNGTPLAVNDDHRTNRTDLAPHDSLIANQTLSDAGRYTIQVAAVDPTMQGNVEILVSSASSSDNSSATSPTQAPASTFTNLTVDDNVPENGTYTYPFQANAGDVLTLTVRATDNQLDPKTTLVDSTGATVASNDDHDSNDPNLGPYDSQIPDFTIPKTDTYTVQITGFAGIGGAFELTITSGAATPASPTPQNNFVPLPTQAPTEATTQVIDGSVNPNDVYTYNLQANAGDVYTITVRATTSNFDPRVAIYLNNDYVADNDDYGGSDPNLVVTDSRIYDLIFTQSGAYEIDVRGYEDSSGNFEMTLEHVASNAPTGLPTEQVELGTVNTGDTYTYNFSAQAGDWVTITARALTTGFDPVVTLISADGTTLMENDDNGSGGGDLGFYDARINNYHIPTSGQYTVEVTDYNGSSGSFGLTIGTLH